MGKKYTPRRLRPYDRTTTVHTTGDRILGQQETRVWAAFTNQGPHDVDIYWIDGEGNVRGELRLAQYGFICLSKGGDMEWSGALSATSIGGDVELSGVEMLELEEL